LLSKGRKIFSARVSSGTPSEARVFVESEGDPVDVDIESKARISFEEDRGTEK
jgi:hypothetical protein